MAGFALTLIGLRNTIAFWSIVKRRMNDVGYRALDFWRDSKPLMIAVLLMIVLVGTQPFIGYTALLIVPIMWLGLWQIKKVATFVWRLVVAPSFDSDEAAHAAVAIAAPVPAGRLDLKIQHWLGHDVSDTSFRKIARAAQDGLSKLSDEAQRSTILADLKAWLDQPVIVASNASAANSSGSLRKARPREKVTYKSPVTRTVVAARSQPKSGRSTLLNGLLRGPWG